MSKGCRRPAWDPSLALTQQQVEASAWSYLALAGGTVKPQVLGLQAAVKAFAVQDQGCLCRGQ